MERQEGRDSCGPADPIPNSVSVISDVASISDYPQASSRSAGATLSHPVMLALFLLTATQPYSLLLGPLLMGPYRLVLLIFALPLLAGWISGRYGRFVLPDFLVLGYVFWVGVSLAANGQGSRLVEYAGGELIDTFVAYLLGRAAVRNKEDLYFFIRAFLILLLLLLPFAVLESTRGMMILQDLYRNLPSIKPFNPTTLTYPSRMGLLRAQTTINHPILYGVFCSIGFSFALVGLRYAGGGMSLLQRMIMVAGSAGGTFFSLSAGAFASLLVQVGLIAWNTILAKVDKRWKIFGMLVAAVYVFLDIAASRPPLVVMSRVVAFSPSTAWNRYQIWVFGTAEVGRHPIFGKGLFIDWVRQPWMPPSIDNYWLLIAMRFGLPGVLFLLVAYLYICTRLVRMNFSPDPEMSAIRYAFVFTFSGVFISLATVSMWHVTYSLVLLVIGAAVWVFNEPPAGSFVPSAKKEASQAAGRKPSREGLMATAAVQTLGEAVGTEEKTAAARRRFTRFPIGPKRPG